MPVSSLRCDLRPTPVQADALRETVEAFRKAAEDVVACGNRLDAAANAVLHRHCYQTLRTTHNLSANLAVRAIAFGARHLRGNSDPPRLGDPVVEYDARIFSFCSQSITASFSTVRGRIRGVGLALPADRSRSLTGMRPRRAILFQGDGCFHLEIDLAKALPTS